MQAFISYCHDDYPHFSEIHKYLLAVCRAYNISVWADKRIVAGYHWDKIIEENIFESHIHILLISPGFLASDYIYEKELPSIANKHRAGSLTIPVVLKRCFWSPFIGVLQAAPMTTKGHILPINDWRPKDHGYDAACQQIANSIGIQFGLKPNSPFLWSTP